MNKSRIIALPKIALSNLCGSDQPTRLEVILVQKKDDKFIKLVPSCPKPKVIEKSQQKIEGMLEKIVDSKTNTDAPNDEDSTPKVKAIDCQCEKITVESEHDQENSEGESQEDDK